MMTSHQTKKTITIIDKPLVIGAKDLLRGVEYTHCGDLHLLVDKFLRKKWIHRYCIISEGFLYTFLDMSSKKPEHVYSLKNCDSAHESEPQEGEIFCFRLTFKSTKSPLHFACDTYERRKEWIERLSETIETIRSKAYTLSADSGYGSAEAVTSHIDTAYNENQSHSAESKTSDSVMEYDYASGFQQINKGTGNQALRGRESDKHIPKKKELKGLIHAEKTARPLQEDFMNELKSGDEEKDDLKMYNKVEEEEVNPEEDGSGSSFLSVRGGSEDVLQLPDSENEDFHVNRDDKYEECGDCYAESFYENTEPPKFQKNEYFCYEKKQMKRELDAMSEGTFAVCPGDSSGQVLSVKTDTGLKHFRIYSQNGMISLFRSHQYNTFSSLNDLLAFYVINDLPKNYRVKLVKGYRSGSK